MQKKFQYSALTSAVLLCLNAAYAQDAEVEQLDTIEVVGSVAKIGRTDFFTPRSVSVITREQLQEQGATQLDQALRYQSGIDAQIYGSDLDDSDWLKVRGFDARMTVDGTAIYKGGYSGWNPDLYGFEAVEVVKGADSLTYGVAPAGGVINLISKRPTLEPQGEVNLKVGSRDERGISGDVSDSLSDTVRYRVVANYNRKQGETNGTWRERYYFAPSLTWDISDRTSLTVMGSVQKDVGVPTTSFYPFEGTVDTSKGKIDRRTNLGDPTTDSMNRKEYSLGYEFKHDFGNDLVFTQNYRYNRDDRYQFGGYYSFVSAFPVIGRGALLVDVTAESHTLDNRLSKTWQGESWENTALVGMDYQYAKAKGEYGYSFSAGSLDAFAPVYSGIAKFTAPSYYSKQHQLGLYAQDRLRLGNWIFSAGVRHDRARGDSDTAPFGVRGINSYRDNHTSYSGSVMYASSIGLAPYYSYSESFEPVPGSNAQGISYKPIEGKQHEVGIKYAPDFMQGEFSVAYFHLQQKNSLIQTSTLATQAGKDTSKGFEFTANAKLLDNLTGVATYTYTDADTTLNSGEVIRKPLTPRHSATVRLAYQWDKLTLGAGVRYVGTTVDQAGNPGQKVAAATLVDLMAKYQFNKNWVVQANVSNLANKRYVSGCYYSCYYGEGRKIDATLSYRW